MQIQKNLKTDSSDAKPRSNALAIAYAVKKRQKMAKGGEVEGVESEPMEMKHEMEEAPEVESMEHMPIDNIVHAIMSKRMAEGGEVEEPESMQEGMEVEDGEEVQPKKNILGRILGEVRAKHMNKGGYC